jgi:hypothetical protein
LLGVLFLQEPITKGYIIKLIVNKWTEGKN